MKTRVITVLSIFTLVSTGCSQGEGRSADDSGLAIRLRAGLTATTKAAVNNGAVFTAAIAGWESSAGSADYTVAATWQAASEITASESSVDIALNPQAYYNQHSNFKTYMKAWFPTGTLTAGRVVFDGTPDGTLDVLLAPELIGSAVDKSGKNLAFKHPLTQIKFNVIGDSGFGATTSVRSITVKDAELPIGLNLGTDAVEYAAPGPVAVQGIDGNQLIGGAVERVGNPVMVKPFAGNTCRIEVETSVTTYPNVTVTIDGDADFIPGKAYTITLRFAGLGVSTSASVTPWDDTGTGSGDVDLDN